MSSRKDEPVRSCVACRRAGSRSVFIRVVRQADGQAAIDETGKAAGRGAYICPAQACLKTAIKKNAFGRALRLTGKNAPSLEHLYDELSRKVAQSDEATS